MSDDKQDMKEVSKSSELKTATINAALWKVAERLGSIAAMLFVQIVLARLLTPTDFGFLAIVTVFINLATVFSQCGLGAALVRAKSVSLESYSSVFWISMLIALMCFIVIFFAAPHIEDFYKLDGLTVVLRSMGVVIFFSAYNSVQIAYLQRQLRMNVQFRATLIAMVVSGVVGVSIAFAGFGVWALVGQQLMNQLTLCVVMSFWVPWRPSFLYSRENARELFSFGWKILAASLLHALYLNVYDLVVGKQFSATMLGYFNHGRKYPLYIESIVDSSLGSVMLSSAAKVGESVEKIKLLLRRAQQVSAFLVFPMMTLLAVVAEPVVVIVFGDQWLPCVPFFQIFCISYMFAPFTRSNLQCVNALGRSDISLKLEIIKKTIAFAILFIVLFTFNDIYALAYSCLLYDLVALVINLHPARSLMNYRLFEQIKDTAAPLLASLLAALFSYFIGTLLPDLWLRMMIQVVVFLLFYGVITMKSNNEAFVYSRELCFLYGKKILLKLKRSKICSKS